jgi:acyl-CoA thioesterase FadM
LSLERFPLHLPRHAFGPRETARAGDIWRLLQEAAVQGSSRRGWTPLRYREAGTAFIVRRMNAVHHREAVFGEVLDAETWVSTFRRGVVSHRELRLAVAGVPLVSATQEWVHVRMRPKLAPMRAPPELVSELAPIAYGDGHVELPSIEPHPAGPVRHHSVHLRFTEMDPLAHANHPAYVDWCDEATSRRLAAVGADPHGLVPVAETVHFRSGAMAPEVVDVQSWIVGRVGDAVALEHRLVGGDGRLCATATTLRRHLDGLEAFGDADRD